MLNRRTSTLLSLGIHIALVTLLFTITFHPPAALVAARALDRATTLIAPYLPHPAVEKQGGGGGGGDRSLLHASRGALPKAAPRQFTPPAAVRYNAEPKLMVEPTIIAAPATLPVLRLAQLGDPSALPGPPSNGTGSGGGIGDGSGGGVGPGNGLGYGPGNNYGANGGDGGFGPGGPRPSITPAALLWKVEPEYSDEARRARLQGTVVLYLEVDNEGRPRNVRVRQSLGLGLDEKAIDAVLHWKFRPGRANGKPVTTGALVEVTFHLL